jgi:hypothetical protein
MLLGKEAVKALAERAGKMGMAVKIVETPVGAAIEVQGSMVEFMRAIRAELAEQESKKTESS